MFFATRTHEEITQVVAVLKELFKDCSNGPPIRMTVLSSRERSCINSSVCGARNVEEACVQQVTDGSCAHYDGRAALVSRIRDHMWDIEDLVTQGKQCSGCPYYAAREMLQGADLVIGPYNFVLDPLIRHHTGIALKNTVRCNCCQLLMCSSCVPTTAQSCVRVLELYEY